MATDWTASRTHCKAGHPYTPENTRIKAGARVCRTCTRAQLRAYRKARGASEWKPGRWQTTEHKSWRSMLKRCYHPSYGHSYRQYGGRGIRVCERWRESFDNFLADMGPKPTPGHSIDRIDTNGHYEPGNCRWATDVEQARNSPRSRKIVVDGQIRPLNDVLEERGIRVSTFDERLYKRKWSFERALTEPVNQRKVFAALRASQE